MNKNQAKTNIFRVITIIVIAVFLLSFSGCQKDSQQTSDVPQWLIDTFYEYPDLMWAYENGYLYEEPIIDEIDGTRLVIWGLLSDDVLTQIVLSSESIEGDECEIFGMVTALDGEPIEADTTAGASVDHGRVITSVPFIYTPALGDHVFTVQFKDRETGSIVLEKKLSLPVRNWQHLIRATRSIKR